MKLGLNNDSLVKFFGSTSRARILTLFSIQPRQSFYQREIMYETGLSLQAVQRELNNLVQLGIIKRHGSYGRVYYRVDPSSSLFKPLSELCESMGRE